MKEKKKAVPFFAQRLLTQRALYDVNDGLSLFLFYFPIAHYPVIIMQCHASI